MNLCDAHCHLANLADLYPLDKLIAEAKEQAITCFLSSALRKCEIEYHLANANPAILFSAGIHPNFDECDISLRDISTLCEERKLWAIGEIGLDRGNAEYLFQIEVFMQQLDLALEYRLPVVLHIVGHQQQAFDILKQYPLKYLVHGYAGSMEGYRQLCRLESYFTVSNRILKTDKQELLAAIVKDARFLFETDITQYYIKDKETNPLLRLTELVRQTAIVTDCDASSLFQAQERNYHALTGEHIQ